jgi:hypothetical protein
VNAIPYAGVAALARAAARTRLVRIALAVTLVALVLATAAVARHPRLHESAQTFVPPKSAGIVVLDLSASISSDTYSRIGETLRRLVATRADYGLVVYSDVAYEALAPGSPAAALAPLVRYFTLPVQAAPGAAPTFPTNPWSRDFTAGTRISAGLELARQIVVDQRIRKPAVVLVSDLADDPQDVQRLTSILLAYRRDRIPLRVVALNPSPDDAAFFERLLARGTAILPARLPDEPGFQPPARGGGFPLWLVVLAVATAVVLAASELRSARLRWGPA